MTEEERHCIAVRAIRGSEGGVPVASVALWECLRSELSKIVGDKGFQSLYARCLHQASSRFPWLENQSSPSADSDFLQLLLRSLQSQSNDEAEAASADFFNTFIDTLILLIGEHLAMNILGKAWGEHIANYQGTECRK
ncbi:hypothetical protein ACHMW6_23950 [Pseudoduganella sp. UC29_106]|uniref:hypothetical protein n=1 Tax=Pseudoduganella sp. UC29_106 TaxID=3374553 RepID=UPI00375728F0